MSRPPVPPEPPTQPLPQTQPHPLPLQGMPPGGMQPPHGPVPVQQQPRKPKRFGWPTVIITAVAALSIGGLVGGADEGSTAAPAATATVTETQPAASEPAQEPEPEPTKKPEPKKTETPEPKAEPAQRVTKREWAKIVKNPDRYAGERYIIYGQVTQFDSATGDEGFRADTAHTNTLSYGIFDGKNTVLSRSANPLDDLVEEDVFRASVEVIGSYDYDTQIGGETSAPHLKVLSIKVIS
ncbi:MAG TPA: hypothetical protein VFY56_11015 [Propionibacteriaceae bacterium]|nr:hypothetical protein [Propionibacteriaceae bacterium]